MMKCATKTQQKRISPSIHIKRADKMNIVLFNNVIFLTISYLCYIFISPAHYSRIKFCHVKI